VAENRFGGNENLVSSGDQLRARLGGWMRDYSMDLTVCSIYRTWGWWLVNLSWRGGGRRVKRVRSRELGGIYRGGLTGDEPTLESGLR
jgi:hypothetical protein